MAERPITYVGVAYPWECDQLGHLNVAHYVAKFDQASWNLMARMGVDRTYITERRRAFAAVAQDIRYLREILPGDTLTVRSVVLEIGEKTCRFLHEMTNTRTGEQAARMEITTVHMDTEARRAVPVSEEIRVRASALLAKPVPRQGRSAEQAS